MLISQRIVTAKIEATQGTDANPGPGTDAMLVENPAWAWTGVRKHQPQSAKATQGSEPSKHGGALRQFSFEVLLKGSGVAGTPPEADALLRACGLNPTVVASTSVSYKRVSDGHEPASIYLYEDERLSKLLGGFGNMALTAEVGSGLRAAFTFTGHSVDPVDTAMPAQTVSSVEPPVYLGAAFTNDTFAAQIGALSIDLANEISTPPDVSSADGYGNVTLVGRAVNGSFDPLDTLPSVYDWVAKWKGDTVALLTSGAFGSTAGNIITINCPRAQINEPTPGDKDKIASLEIAFDARENTGDDEFELIFT